MREQYLDFAIGRQFRKSLIVHADRAPAMLQNPEGTKFADMHFGTLPAASGHQTRRAPL